MAEKQIEKEWFGGLPFKDRFLIRLSRYMPSMIRRRIVMKYLPSLVLNSFNYALRKVKDEMGDEAFQKMLDQTPIDIIDKDGTWTLPAGTTREEVYQFLVRLRERRVDKKGEKVNV